MDTDGSGRGVNTDIQDELAKADEERSNGMQQFRLILEQYIQRTFNSSVIHCPKNVALGISMQSHKPAAMSGFEVAGLVLGIIPIALKSYTELGAFFTDFRRYRIQGVRLRLKYANEADLFQASIRTLLSYSIDGNVVSAMLDDPEHASWSDRDIQISLGMVLDGDLNLCEAVRSRARD
ncbi:hypothetical protein SLS58_006057 [Diplodia intermedia]|uniref:Uncharacterized protein n=1 Tax=Diplodia intermedia TaxID=856260 RepID=A0ABR3TPI3_9PEZI